MGRRGPLSRFDLDEVRRLLETSPPSQLPPLLGCSRSTAYALASKTGYETTTKAATDEYRERWRQALAEEPTQAAAARRMGVSRQAASKMAKRLREDRSPTDAREGMPPLHKEE